MDNPSLIEISKLTKEQLLDLIKINSRNWNTLDGLWFSAVEEKFGLEAALELDILMWKTGSLIEAKRIKELLNINKGGLPNIMKTINLMSWAPSLGYEYEITDKNAVWTCTRCLPQEKRVEIGKGEFPCKPTFEACFGNVCKVIDPQVTVSCTFCPPDPHPDDAWCQWEFNIR
ncbi:MAG: DUF6125 family protein [Thermodesulfobacteriota bacterium]|nr:DUF6125 family protein [Thermodesulfobacteriota bacterium]